MVGRRKSTLGRARWLISSDLGRDDGWTVELDGRVVGELHNPRWEDMFWYSYAVRRLGESDSPLDDDALWNECRFSFRSRTSGERVDRALVGGTSPYVQSDRVLMRGLYLEPSSLVERGLLFLRDVLPSHRRVG